MIGVVYCIYLKTKNKLILTRELTAGITILFFLIHPDLAKFFLGFFSCKHIDDEGFHLRNNLDIECLSDEHIIYGISFVIPSIAVWILGIPTFVLWYMIRNRKKLDKLQYKFTFGFLYNGYHIDKYY